MRIVVDNDRIESYNQSSTNGGLVVANFRTCEVAGCGGLHKADGLCGMHYLRRKRTGSVGDAGAVRPASSRPIRVCEVEGCELPSVTKGMCPAHYQQMRRGGVVKVGQPVRRYRDGTPTKNADGYMMVSRPGHPSAYGNGQVYVHRLVMEEVLGRSLLPNENVHHRNGNRADNRPENLELWVVSQPAGQRVEDLVAWARNVLAQYEPVMTRLVEHHMLNAKEANYG